MQQPTTTHLTVALGSPERNRAFNNSNYLNLRYLAKMHEVDYSHLAFNCDYIHYPGDKKTKAVERLAT